MYAYIPDVSTDTGSSGEVYECGVEPTLSADPEALPMHTSEGSWLQKSLIGSSCYSTWAHSASMQMAAGPPLPEIKAGDVWNLLKNGKEDSAEEAVDDTVNVISSPWWAATLLQGMWKIDMVITFHIWGLSCWYEPGKSSLIIWQKISALPPTPQKDQKSSSKHRH